MAFRVAVVGSGPAGLYAAEALGKQADGDVLVDVIDRLPTPYGLVRYGVAPDHPSIKSIADYLRRVLETPGVQFVGGVELGRDVTREELRAAYDAVIYATGAMVDRRLGIPGEDLPGSVAATDFVNWYCGHPDAEDQTFDLSAGEVAVIGVGNVAVDVARILARQPDDLHPTDVPEAALKHLRDSRVRRVHVVGRRGPVHAKFTPKELRELGRLTGVSVHVDPRDMPDDEFAAQAEGAERSARVNLTVLREWAERPGDAAERRIDVHFWSRPVEILGTDRVEGLRLERTQLVDGRVAGTGEFETLRVGMVLRSVGYQSVPLPGVPFDEATKRIPNEAGRVLDGAGRPSPGEYVAGWIKRGPTGVVGTNKSDAAETVRSMLADLAEAPADGTKAGGIEAVLAARGVPVVDYASWLGIDAAEIALAESLGRGARVKLAGWEALRTASKR